MHMHYTSCRPNLLSTVSATIHTRRMDLEIVDSHVHFWSPQTHPWLTKAAEKGGYPAGSFTAPEYAKEIVGYNVSRCVHIEAAWPPDDPVGETK